MKTYGGSRGLFISFLVSTLETAELSASCYGYFSSDEEPPLRIQQEEGWALESV